MNVAAGVVLRPAACSKVRTAKPDQHGAVCSDWEDIKVFILRLTVSLSLFHISWCVTMTTASNIFCRRVTEKPTQPFSGCSAWLWVISQSLRLTSFIPAQDSSAINISPARCVSRPGWSQLQLVRGCYLQRQTPSTGLRRPSLEEGAGKPAMLGVRCSVSCKGLLPAV